MTLGDLPGRLDYPMIIVTAAAGDERSGCLVGFHTQCSIHPPRWAVWISVENHTYRVARDADTLAVHFPGEDDRDLAALFGSVSDDDVDKFQFCDWHAGPNGVPVLDRLTHRFVGTVVDVVDDGGDHVLFVLDPHDVTSEGDLRQLNFRDVDDLDPGHPA